MCGKQWKTFAKAAHNPVDIPSAEVAWCVVWITKSFIHAFSTTFPHVIHRFIHNNFCFYFVISRDWCIFAK